jgi:hypothetical protein
MNLEKKSPESKGERLLEELRKYALISAYLFIFFAVILIYEASMQGTGTQHPTVPWSVAIVKALVLGKFILIGDALSVGARARHHALLYRVVWKSVAMLIVLIVFKILEELIVGWVHGNTPAKVLGEFLERTWLQDVAPLLLMLLVLVPMILASEIYRAVGATRFREFLNQS